jgi:ATP-dependent DNA helicase RecQ
VAKASEGSDSELEELGQEMGLSLRRLVAALDRLAQAGGDPAAAAELEEAHTRMEQSRVDMVRSYAESRGCRRQVLLGYFGEELRPPCSGCDRCDAGLGQQRCQGSEDGDRGFPLGSAVRHPEWGPGQVMGRDGDKLTVVFESAGYRTLSLSVVEERKLLEVEP